MAGWIENNSGSRRGVGHHHVVDVEADEAGIGALEPEFEIDILVGRGRDVEGAEAGSPLGDRGREVGDRGDGYESVVGVAEHVERRGSNLTK